MPAKQLTCYFCVTHLSNRSVPPCPAHQQDLEAAYYTAVQNGELVPAGDESTFYARRDHFLLRTVSPDKTEERYYILGAGVWFRNSDNKRIVVHCVPHPTNLWYKDEKGEDVIVYKEELDRDYHR